VEDVILRHVTTHESSTEHDKSATEAHCCSVVETVEEEEEKKRKKSRRTRVTERICSPCSLL
jgi:hypothetical protein